MTGRAGERGAAEERTPPASGSQTAAESSRRRGEPFPTRDEPTPTRDELTPTRDESTPTRDEPTRARDELAQTQTELAQTQTELAQTRSELARARAELAQSGSALAARDADIELVLRAAGHDLKSPLKTLTGFLELVAAEHRSPLLDAAREMAADLAGLCEGLLEYTGLGALRPVRQRVLFGPVARRVRDGLLLEVADRGAQVEIGGEAVELHTDPTLLGRALVGLLANALVHAGRGRAPRVRLEACALVGGGVRVAVEDDGPGVPAPDRTRVFEPLVRLPDAVERGHGLGLAQVRRACALLGAAVVIVDPVALGGCRVELTLPAPG